MLSVFIKTMILYVLLVFVMKIIGKRRIGELEADELVSTLLISEIAAMPISDPNIPLLNSIIPILFIVSLEVLLAAIKNKWRVAKRLLEGAPTYIIYKGRLIAQSLSQNRISVNEVITEMRLQGIGSLSEIYCGILEANGRLSLIKNGDILAHSVIIDGEIHDEELLLSGKTRNWLDKKLKEKNLTPKDVLLFYVDEEGKADIITKEKNK